MRIDDLKKVAAAATPGPWEVSWCNTGVRMDSPKDNICYAWDIDIGPDTTFIITFNPELVLKLLAALEAGGVKEIP